MTPTQLLATRYAAWLGRHARAVVVVCAVVAVLSSVLVGLRLPVLADLSYLLPPDAPAVRDLRRLSERVVARDTVLVVVSAPDRATRAAATAALATAAAEIDADLVERVEQDDAEARAFFAARRHLYVPLGELIAARDALRHVIDEAKLRANPLFVDLDDDPGAAPRDLEQLDALGARYREAARATKTSRFVSADGTHGLVIVGTAFPSIDVAAGARLLGALDRIRAGVTARYAGVEIGFAGGVPTTVAEHRALVDGIVWASVLTGLLVSLLLIGYLRSARLVVLLALNMGVAIAVAFAVAVFTVGHLNAATAFLGAIIAGNGINYGILVTARYREERTSADPLEAMGHAIAATLRPTLVASLGAAIAYGSLAATSFRGFADFATIGAVGMLLCWISSYVLLPAAILRFAPGVRGHAATASWSGRLLAGAFGRARPRRMGALAASAGVASLVLAAWYVASGPFEYDLRALRSSGPAAAETQRWIEIADKEFGEGITGSVVFAADRFEQVPLIVDAVRRLDAHRSPDQRVIEGVWSILEVIPPDQAARLRVLGELRAAIDDPVLDRLDPEARRRLAELRPPDGLREVTVADLPWSIRDPLTERDGRVGYLVALQPAATLDRWDGRDLLRLAAEVRSVRLGNGEVVTTSGPSVVFADILAAIQRDGSVVTLVAVVLLIGMVSLTVRRARPALAVFGAATLGTLAMVATCAVLGLRVNFLDFVALPITLGLGVDYAINIAHRAASGEPRDTVLRTTGSAVLVCSLTTVIGYASLLVSDNGAIRSFALPLLIGELTCVVAAFAVVPAVVYATRAVSTRRDRRR